MLTLTDLQQRFGAHLWLASFTGLDEAALALVRLGPGDRRLALVSAPDDPRLTAFTGAAEDFGGGQVLRLCALDHANAARLREVLPHLQPRPLGLQTSAGMGDRLGLATPGHVRAVRHTGLAPIFAQQSIREMTRTGRSPVEVLDDATWGAFQEGWRGPLGADADHLKTPADIDATAPFGFSFYTIDPGEHVDDGAGVATPQQVQHQVNQLPWEVLESSPRDLVARFVSRTLDLGDRALTMTADEVWRVAMKYGRAVAHIVRLYRYLAAKAIPFELEVSVDETETPTTHAEHYYVASELKRLGVRWVSLAPRFVGCFEKGVDYLGDLETLAADLAGHARVARALGPYKLSLHSGSDKFSIYPLIMAATQGLVHLKTAGTSYLEALRTLARGDPALFRAILALARDRYSADRVTYHVSADLGRVPAPETLADDHLPGLLDQFDARQVLHVTFGSVLLRYGETLKAAVRAREADYWAGLAAHFERHLRPFRREG